MAGRWELAGNHPRHRQVKQPRRTMAVVEGKMIRATAQAGFEKRRISCRIRSKSGLIQRFSEVKSHDMENFVRESFGRR